MSEADASTANHDVSMQYEVRIKGHLDPRWADWFEGLNITLEKNGDTVLTSPALDQAALHRLLKKVRDLGMTLRSVNLREENTHE